MNDGTSARNLEQFAAKSAPAGAKTTVPCARKTRFMAFVVDAVVFGILNKGCVSVMHMLNFGPVADLLWLCVGPFLYFVLPTYVNGQTLGKMLLKIKVVMVNGDADLSLGTVLRREWLGRFVSVIVFFVGYLRIFFAKDHRGWHDQIAKTQVISLDSET